MDNLKLWTENINNVQHHINFIDKQIENLANTIDLVELDKVKIKAINRFDNKLFYVNTRLAIIESQFMAYIDFKEAYETILSNAMKHKLELQFKLV